MTHEIDTHIMTVGKAKIDNLRLYVSVTDPVSIDGFPQGWDPEAAYNAYIARTFNFGVSIKF